MFGHSAIVKRYSDVSSKATFPINTQRAVSMASEPLEFPLRVTDEVTREGEDFSNWISLRGMGCPLVQYLEFPHQGFLESCVSACIC